MGKEIVLAADLDGTKLRMPLILISRPSFNRGKFLEARTTHSSFPNQYNHIGIF